jgi:OOP family OmpA-OmpF porin
LVGLEKRAVSATTVAEVLPEAAADASRERLEALAIGLEPAVGIAVREVVRREPERIGEILAPTIGAAVKKAVSDAVAAMLERLDAVLDRSLSIRNIKWRIEAKRTGRPFAEVVLLRTLKYRVEQVFLIHTETSLVLQHVVAPELKAESPDQVAAMLSAVDAFGREAFGLSPPGSHLEKFKIGDLTVWVDRDSTLTLASVIRGVPGMDLPERLSEVRTRIGLTYSKELTRFSGDVASFVPTRPELESLLTSEQVVRKKRAGLWLAVLGMLLVAGILALAWRGHTRSVRVSRERAAIVEALEREPGIVVTSADVDSSRRRITGFRDPLASAPDVLLARAGLPLVETELLPFVSLDPRILERRISRALEPPPGVTIAVDDGTLHVAGVAPRTWIHEARLVARSLLGIARVDDAALRPSEALAALRESREALEANVILFDSGKSQPSKKEGRLVERAADEVRRALALASEAHLDACIELIGQADLPGTPARNQALSEMRAAAIASQLTSLGIDNARLSPHGSDPSAPDGAMPTRSVTFRLHTAPYPSSCSGAP